MKTTITKQLMGLALGVISLSASAQCPAITSVGVSYGANGQVNYTANLSSAITASNTTFGVSSYNSINNNSSWTSFGNSNTGSVNYSCNDTYVALVSYNDSTTTCYGTNTVVVTVTNAANTCSTTQTPTNAPCSAFTGSFITSADRKSVV